MASEFENRWRHIWSCLKLLLKNAVNLFSLNIPLAHLSWNVYWLAELSRQQLPSAGRVLAVGLPSPAAAFALPADAAVPDEDGWSPDAVAPIGEPETAVLPAAPPTTTTTTPKLHQQHPSYNHDTNPVTTAHWQRPGGPRTIRGAQNGVKIKF